MSTRKQAPKPHRRSTAPGSKESSRASTGSKDAGTRAARPSRTAKLAAAGVALAVQLAVPSEAEARRPERPVRYHVAVERPATQYVEVAVEIADIKRRKTTRLSMPAWTPGSYLVRDFARNVYDVRAETLDGAPLTVTRVDKQTWEVTHGKQKAFRLRYRVFADDLSVRTSYVGSEFALLNGASVFVYVDGALERPCEVEVDVPLGWAVHTALRRDGEVWRCSDYDELVDSPLLLGKPKVETFRVGEANFEYVWLAPTGSNAKVERLASDAEKLAGWFAKAMGGLPFPRYVFLVVADDAGGGGLEHFSSTAMIVQPRTFVDAKSYRDAAELAAHEFFHLWNVKRIHDRPLGPFDYAKEVYTELLWLHEGFTVTMESRAMVGAGLIDARGYLESLAKDWNTYVDRPGRRKDSLATLSRDTWIRLYKPGANHRNVTVSYYLEGGLVGHLLDLELRLRAAKHGRTSSIEALFARLWAERKAGANERAIDAEVILAAASAEAGEDMRWFFDDYVFGTKALPLTERLAALGVKATAKAPWDGVEDPVAAARKRPWTGIVGRGETVGSVDVGSPAEAAGVMIGDELVAVAGTRVRSLEAAEERFRDHAPGDEVTVLFTRRGRVMETRVTLAEDPRRTWTFELVPSKDLTPEVAGLRKAWIGE